MDVVSSEKRSQMMAGIRSKNTKPEILVRMALHSRGYRYRLHRNSIQGKPDLYLKKYNAVIFIHGCFWHQHDCHLFKWPSSRQDFWKDKIGKNHERDIKTLEKLEEEGFRVLIIWECAIKGKTRMDFDLLIFQVEEWLHSDNRFTEIGGEM